MSDLSSMKTLRQRIVRKSKAQEKQQQAGQDGLTTTEQVGVFTRATTGNKRLY